MAETHTLRGAIAPYCKEALAEHRCVGGQTLNQPLEQAPSPSPSGAGRTLSQAPVLGSKVSIASPLAHSSSGGY